MAKPAAPAGKPKPNLFALLVPYKGLIAALVLLAVAANAFTLVIPRIIQHAIDAYTAGTFALDSVLWQFGGAAALVFFFTYLQHVVQTYAAEKVARDMRTKLASVISLQSNEYVQNTGPSVLLTNLTSDADGVKTFISQAIAAIISSIFLIIGASVLLLITDWPLALATLTVIPIIGGTFFGMFSRVRPLFRKGQEVIDKLNKVINESILASALIRVLHSQQNEQVKFTAANANARDIGMSILRLFAAMIPIVMFVSNLATLIILALGGHYVIVGDMTLGSFAAFNSYMGILIFPIFVLGFMSNIMARAGASYARIAAVLDVKPEEETGTLKSDLSGAISVKNVNVHYGEKNVLKDASFEIPAGSKTAIIGPTAAGKTQLLYVLTGLIKQQSGDIEYDGKPMRSYDSAAFHKQVGLVFQDSVIFNLTLRENIAFNESVTEADLNKAIETAELGDFIASLPQGLDTVVSERGTSLSGGQKQRIMLARALALNPRILFLDDFTARVDAKTEASILGNVEKNYPGITLISVTQKISAAERSDQVILLMEGEVLATGTHEELMHSSPEYAQIEQSQHSTNTYELRAE